MLRSALDLEFVRASVAATDQGDPIDPSGDPIAFAFVVRGAVPDDETTFTSGNWETDDSDPSNPVYYARVLVGPGGTLELAAGQWDCYLKVVDNPEIVVQKVGTLVIV